MSIQELSHLFEKLTFKPNLNLQLGKQYTYEIEMENKFLNTKGIVKKQQKLTSNFIKTVEQMPNPYLGILNYSMKKVEFYAKKDAEPMPWHFAEKLEFPQFMYCGNTEEALQAIYNAYNEEGGVIAQTLKGFDDAFVKYPKLYSVYLLIMQVYDIVTVDRLVSHMLSMPELFKEMGKVIEIKSMSQAQCQIDSGLYSEGSVFKNGKFYGIFQGVNYYEGRVCYVVSYYCDESRVKMVDATKDVNRMKNGSSYYSGSIYIDIASGMPVFANMLEQVVAVQQQEDCDKQIPTNIRRRINMKLISEG